MSSETLLRPYQSTPFFFFLLGKYPTEVFGKDRYGPNTGTRRFGKFGTTSIPVPDNSVTWVRPPKIPRVYTGVIYNALPNIPLAMIFGVLCCVCFRLVPWFSSGTSCSGGAQQHVSRPNRKELPNNMIRCIWYLRLVVV